MTFKTKYATYENCEWSARQYGNGNLALQVVSEEDGPICVCTVNPGERVDDGRIAIKDYSENEGMVDTLLEMGIIKGDPLYTIPSGWVQIPVYELTDKGLALWGLERLSAK